MFITTKISIRNVIANRRRSFLIGLVIFMTTFLLLVSNAFVNGVEKQVLKSYDNIQASNVVVVWETLAKVDKKDATRFLFLEANSFETKDDAANKAAIKKLDDYLKQHQDDVKAYYPTVRRPATLTAGDKSDNALSVYGLSKEYKDYLFDTKAVSMYEGELLASGNSIAISKQKADDDKIKLGDTVKVDGVSPKGEMKTKEFVVKGIYANGAGWDNGYGFMSNESAKDLFQYDAAYFDLGKIFLKDMANADAFAAGLDKALHDGGSNALSAESRNVASGMYPVMSMTLKAMFNMFIFFLLVVIAIGLRSTIRMNLFERMREFGTLRAIGYSRRQCFSIIFNEALFLSLFSLAAAFVVSIILVKIVENTGVYLGSGPLSYFGGEYLYPTMNIADVIIAVVVLVLFSLISTFNPGLTLMYQNITDIVAKRQKKVFVIGALLRSLFGKGPKMKNNAAKSAGM